MPFDNYIALVIDGLAVALVVALTALYSVSAGAAMTSHLTFTETSDGKRRCKISDGSPTQCYRARRPPTSLSDLESLFCGVARFNE
jgi:hypothetical protein